MKHFRIRTIALLLGMAFGPQEMARTGVRDSIDVQRLSLSALQQAAYDLPWRDGIATDLLTVEDVAVRPPPAGSVIFLSEGEMPNFSMPVIHRDLDGDGFEDALVMLAIVPTAEGNPDEPLFALATVLNRAGQPEHVASNLIGVTYEAVLEGSQVVTYTQTEPYGEEFRYVYDWQVDGLKFVDRQPISLDTPLPEKPDRYRAVRVEQLAQGGTVTANPLQYAEALLFRRAGEEGPPTEGRYREWSAVVETTDNRQVIAITKTGLLDDSMGAIRYRLEFEAVGQQWQLVWAGQQFSCQAGRGRQVWHPEFCS